MLSPLFGPPSSSHPVWIFCVLSRFVIIASSTIITTIAASQTPIFCFLEQRRFVRHVIVNTSFLRLFWNISCK